MNDKNLKIWASVGLALGGIFGIAGTMAPSASLRGIAWLIDGVGIVLAGALLSVHFLRRGEDIVAAGYLVLAIAEGLMLSCASMALGAATPIFGGGISLWALAIALVSSQKVFPPVVRGLGWIAVVLFTITALQIFGGTPLTPTSAPLPSYSYPFFVATFVGWIWTLLRK